MFNRKHQQHIMALITFLALVPLVYFIPDWIEPLLPESKLINVIAAVGLIVPIISYGVMPLCQRCLAKYLYF